VEKNEKRAICLNTHTLNMCIDALTMVNFSVIIDISPRFKGKEGVTDAEVVGLNFSSPVLRDT